MKRICTLACLFFVLLAMTAFADSPRFDNMRTVLIVQTNQDSYAAHFMKQRLRAPFRIPYWDRVETTEVLDPQELTQDRMRALASQYKADVVVAPIVNTWYWTQHHVFFFDDDDLITEYMYNLTVFAYNTQQDTLKSYSARGYERESIASLNDPNEILTEAMDKIMKKLPYKRIPTDIEKPSPVLQTKTTDGGATILTNTQPMMI